MTAIEMIRAELTVVRSKPVVVQDVQQHHLHDLIAPLDAIVNGIVLRLPAGTVIALDACGAGGAIGSLQCDVDFRALNGRTYRATKGMQLRVPA